MFTQIAQVFPSLRVLDRARAQLAYLRLPGFGEPPGTGFESLAPGFETRDAFLAARYEAEGFLVNTTDTDTAAEAVKRIPACRVPADARKNAPGFLPGAFTASKDPAAYGFEQVTVTVTNQLPAKPTTAGSLALAVQPVAPENVEALS